MKNLQITPALALGLALMVCSGMPAFADDWGWDEGAASASAGFSSWNSAGFDVGHGHAKTFGVGDTDTSANPQRAEGEAWLMLSAKGHGYDDNELRGGLWQEGSTYANADVGCWGQDAGSYTLGTADVYGSASGHNSGVVATFSANSEQHSHVVDNNRNGGYSTADAEQHTEAMVMGWAQGRTNVHIVPEELYK